MSDSDETRLTNDDEMYRRVYGELKRMASRQLRVSDDAATLSTTELVHETFLKLSGDSDRAWEGQGRPLFFGAAARAMRQVLVDFARRRRAAKRGGGAARVSLSGCDLALDVELDEILALDAALERLTQADERLRRIVEMRFFGGFSEKEIAESLGVTTRTVEREWLKAKVFLLRELESSGDRGPDQK